MTNKETRKRNKESREREARRKVEAWRRDQRSQGQKEFDDILAAAYERVGLKEQR